MLITLFLLALTPLLTSANPVGWVPREPVVPVPKSTLPFTHYLNLKSGRALLAHDVARAAAFRTRNYGTFSGDKIKRNIGSTPGEFYGTIWLASVGVGTPPTQYSLVIDTGSSNTWVGNGKPYVQTPSSANTDQPISVRYGSGGFSGTEYLDTVTLSHGLVVKNQSIGVAASTTEIPTFINGILGLGPVDLTLGTLTLQPDQEIPTVTDTLFEEGTIPTHSIGISFTPYNPKNNLTGEITWGGFDSTKFNAPLTYTPVTTTKPAGSYWGVEAEIQYGSTVIEQSAGIVDTGTSLLLISSNAFQTYASATGATIDQTTGLLSLTPAGYANLKPVYLTIGPAKYAFTPNAQIWPRALNEAIGGSANMVYLIIASTGEPSGQGFDFILGQAWLQRFYSVYDTGNNRIGLANTPYTDATTN